MTGNDDSLIDYIGDGTLTSALLALFIGQFLPMSPPNVLRTEVSSRVDRQPSAAKRVDDGRSRVDTLVVCAPALRAALGPWLTLRASQGHRIAILSRYRGAAQIRRQIRQLAASGGLRTIVLVGDTSARIDCELPTHMVPAKINVTWGSEPEIASDNWYADVDDDVRPDLSIGRLPAGNPDELTSLVKKILDYERQPPDGKWQRRVNLVAGVGGFGLVADTVIETAARTFICRGIPNGYRTQLTYASWRSPYCPDPRLFRDEVIESINQGCLCWVYIGHGLRDGLDWVRVPIGVTPILTKDDVGRLNAKDGSPIAVFLSCYGAAFDGPSDCLAELMLQEPGGPVAVIGGTRITMPYGMAVLSRSLMRHLFDVRPETLGEVVLHAKRDVLEPDSKRRHPILDTMARAISPNPDDLVGERREHVQMFHLLGDPLLRVPAPDNVDINVPRSIQPGQALHVVCNTRVLGSCIVELTCPRGQLTFQPKPRTEFDGTHDGMRALSETYRRANDDCYVSQQMTVNREQFETSLSVPRGLAGACLVRVFIRGATSFGLGAVPVYVGD